MKIAHSKVSDLQIMFGCNHCNLNFKKNMIKVIFTQVHLYIYKLFNNFCDENSAFNPMIEWNGGLILILETQLYQLTSPMGNDF